jgi:glycosyltransferase involved in cell wall biosynthesis
VVHNETGLIVPVRDGAALAQAVERLLENPNEALAMGRAGRARAIESYDYEIVKKRFIGFLDDIILDSRIGRKSQEKSRP